MFEYDGSSFDFVDFGASHGGCIDFAKRSLGGENGFGIDLDINKVKGMQALGYQCIQGDITRLGDIPDSSVRFVTMSHVLEHLPNADCVSKAIQEAIRISSEFIFIQGPYFDADDYLSNLGLKFYWSDWSGHTFHLTSGILSNIFKDLSVNDYELLARLRVESSADDYILPLSAQINQHHYDATIHPPKDQSIKFDIPIYKELVSYLKLSDVSNWSEIIKAREGTVNLLSTNESNGKNLPSKADK